MATRLRSHLLISGWLRQELPKSSIIPHDIFKSIEQWYPLFITIEGSKLGLTDNEKLSLTEFLRQFLAKQNVNHTTFNLSSKLLYDGKRDGHGAAKWHDKVDGNANTLTLIETEYHHIFGCFACHKYQSLNYTAVNKSSFLFVIRTVFENADCPKIIEFDGNHGTYDHKNCGPCFGMNFFYLGIFAYKETENYTYLDHDNNYPGFQGNELVGGESWIKTDDIHRFTIQNIGTHKIEIQ